MPSRLMALSAIDGRYGRTGEKLEPYFSEFGLIKARLVMQVDFLLALAANPKITCVREVTEKEKRFLYDLTDISEADAQVIKDIETKGYGDIKATNHDVVAAIAWLRMKMQKTTLDDLAVWVHFGRTSEDCNNIAYALMLRSAIRWVLLPEMRSVIRILDDFANAYRWLAMLARTHGQPATPTTLGKEFAVFMWRLERQYEQLEDFKIRVKLNGASGNHCADVVAFPEVNWVDFAEDFVIMLNRASPESMGLILNPMTTQIEPHDTYAELFAIFMRFNTILVDLCQDVWRYISDDYLVQQAVEGEVGSSAMPHKVNPIDFENAEGNLQFANAMLEFFARKLPISRLQRDLSDSTVERNFGLALGHCLHGYTSVLKGLRKIAANEVKIGEDLRAHPEVLAEAYQTILRRAGYPNAYNALKDITRGKVITVEHLREFVEQLTVPENIRAELQALTPETYIGLAPFLVLDV